MMYSKVLKFNKPYLTATDHCNSIMYVSTKFKSKHFHYRKYMGMYKKCIEKVV